MQNKYGGFEYSQNNTQHKNVCRTNACRTNACRTNACRTNACRTNTCRTNVCRTNACTINCVEQILKNKLYTKSESLQINVVLIKPTILEHIVFPALIYYDKCRTHLSV